MANFEGKLNSNEIFASLFNMIISQQVFADNIKNYGLKLADMCRVDGSLYGDTKLYYSADVLPVSDWGNDAEAANLLQLHRPKAPECQAITLDQFKMIAVTVDNYLSKRAWSTEGAFSSFNSVMLGMLRETKKVYDATTINTFIPCKSMITIGLDNKEGIKEVDVDYTNIISTTDSYEQYIRAEALTLADKLGQTMTSLTNPSRQWNGYGFMRSYDPSDFVIVWDARAYNRIKKAAGPTLFKDVDVLNGVEQVELPTEYFGYINDAGDAAAGDGSERKYMAGNIGSQFLFSGEALPASLADQSYNENEIYFPQIYQTINASANSYVKGDILKDDVVCVIMHKKALPFMSAFETGTNFFNPRSLTDTHYLIWGHNTLEFLKEYPVIIVREKWPTAGA